jgi:hypothetical protein
VVYFSASAPGGDKIPYNLAGSKRTARTDSRSTNERPSKRPGDFRNGASRGEPPSPNGDGSKKPEPRRIARPPHTAASQTNCRISTTSKIITSTAITKLSIPESIYF